MKTLRLALYVFLSIACGICSAQKPASEPAAAQERVSDEELHRALTGNVKGLSIDEKQVRAHVIRPQNIVGVLSDRGRAEGKLEFVPRRPIVGALPYHLNVSAFGAALHDALKDSVAGYTVRLRQNGQTIYTKDWQWAKGPHDGSESWTPDVQLHIASVSKLITAIAMTRLMTEKKISPDAQIINYLPDYWAKGPNIQYITFRNLLDHTSGLTAVDDFDFLNMKAAIAKGISLDPNAADHLGHYHYQNINFGLCRILLTVMNGNISKSANFPLFFNDIMWDLVTISGYAAYAENKVFSPSGVSGATFDHPSAAGLAYRFPVDSGWNSGSLSNVSGAAGWHLSADQVLDVMGQFRRGGGIVSAQTAQTMLDNGFGVDLVGIPTPAGKLYNKNGIWYDSQTNGHMEQSLAYFLPENMELVVLANSPVGSPQKFFRDLVTQIYVDNLVQFVPLRQ